MWGWPAEGGAPGGGGTARDLTANGSRIGGVRWSLIHVVAVAAVAAGCAGDEQGRDGVKSTAEVPKPERFAAREVELTRCRQGSGSKIRVAGMNCKRAAPITKEITTAFADANLRKEVVDRGNGWRCFQRLFDGAAAVEQVCWRGRGQVLIFEKG